MVISFQNWELGFRSELVLGKLHAKVVFFCHLWQLFFLPSLSSRATCHKILQQAFIRIKVEKTCWWWRVYLVVPSCKRSSQCLNWFTLPPPPLDRWCEITPTTDHLTVACILGDGHTRFGVYYVGTMIDFAELIFRIIKHAQKIKFKEKKELYLLK